MGYNILVSPVLAILYLLAGIATTAGVLTVLPDKGRTPVVVSTLCGLLWPVTWTFLFFQKIVLILLGERA